MLNRVDLSSRRNDINDGMVLTDDGRAFQARVAAAGKARSPSVDRRVGGTSVGAASDRRLTCSWRMACCNLYHSSSSHNESPSRSQNWHAKIGI